MDKFCYNYTHSSENNISLQQLAITERSIIRVGMFELGFCIQTMHGKSLTYAKFQLNCDNTTIVEQMRASSGFRIVCKPSRQCNRGHKPQLHRRLELIWKKLVIYGIIMPRCACASEVYGSVFVSVCVCVSVSVSVQTAIQLLKDESSASKSFYRLLVMFTWILIRAWICKIMLRSQVLLPLNAFSEECVTKLVHNM